MHFQWQQLLVVIIAFGAPAASWAFGKLREQYEKKRQADLRRTRDEESIRVQRTAERLDQPSPQVQAHRRIEELTARRQAQLEELRRRRAGAPARGDNEARPAVMLAPTAPPTARTPAQGPMRPGIPGTPMRLPTPVAQRPGMPQPPVGGARPGRHPSQPPTARQRPPARPAQPRTPPLPETESRPIAAPRPAPMPSIAPAMTGPQQRAFNAAKTPGALARAMLIGKGSSPTVTVATAFALTEILSKPVALRENQFDDRVSG